MVTEKPGGWGNLPESLGTRTCSPSSTHHLDSGRKDLAGCQSDPTVPPQCSKARVIWEETALEACCLRSYPISAWALWPWGSPVTLLHWWFSSPVKMWWKCLPFTELFQKLEVRSGKFSTRSRYSINQSYYHSSLLSPPCFERTYF